MPVPGWLNWKETRITLFQERMEKKNQEHRIESDAGRGRYGETAPVPRRRFRMGSREFYPEERPVDHAEAGPFRMDLHPEQNGPRGSRKEPGKGALICWDG